MISNSPGLIFGLNKNSQRCTGHYPGGKKGDEYMNRIDRNVGSGILGLTLLVALSFPSWAADVPRITRDELKGMLGKENVVIIDVRSDIDLEKSNQKIQGAVIEDAGKVDTWMAKYPKDKTLVFYCS